MSLNRKVSSAVKALIFTEGGKKIGLGHITRCLSLKDAFISQGLQAMLIVRGDALVRKQFRGQFDRVFDWLSQEARTGKLLKGASIAVVDSYLAPIDFYKKIFSEVPVPVFIDDFVRLPYPPGIVVNGTVGAEKMPYSRHKKRQYLLGAKYALLRKDFWRNEPRKTRKYIRDVLVTFGGMDLTEFIEKMLAYLRPKFPNWHFHIVAAQPPRRTRRVDENSSLYSGLSARKIKDLMARCDIAISGGGQTTNELAVCGLPSVGICFAENQKFNIQGWQKVGFLKYAGHFNDPAIFKTLEAKLRQMTFARRRAMGKRGEKTVGGMGAILVGEAVTKIGDELHV